MIKIERQCHLIMSMSAVSSSSDTHGWFHFAHLWWVKVSEMKSTVGIRRWKIPCLLNINYTCIITNVMILIYDIYIYTLIIHSLILHWRPVNLLDGYENRLDYAAAFGCATSSIPNLLLLGRKYYTTSVLGIDIPDYLMCKICLYISYFKHIQ